MSRMFTPGSAVPGTAYPGQGLGMPTKYAVPTSAIPGDVYPGQVIRLFNPPRRKRRLDDRDRLFSRMSFSEGLTVLKQSDGSFVTVEVPTNEQLAAAAAVYAGGHIHQVSLEEADALTAAGYEVIE